MKEKIIYILLMDWDYDDSEIEGLYFTLKDAMEIVDSDSINKTMGWIIEEWVVEGRVQSKWVRKIYEEEWTKYDMEQ